MGLRRIAGVFGTGLIVAGCAISDVTLMPTLPASVATGSRRGEGREILVFRPFVNQRPQARCGMKKNGYNTESASILCGRDPAFTLADLLVGELAAAGFKVIQDPRSASPSTLVLTGALEQAFLEPKANFSYVTFETDIALHLTVQNAAGLVAQRRFYVKGEEATYFASEDDMQRSFDSAARQLVTNVVGAVANLADRFPPGIAPPAPKDAPLQAAPPEGTP
ncbi:MAG: exported protein of unknown function [Myxococcales bacterium]|nr:exported protein of unknown function [Myxococcales bacterium]